MVKSQVDFDDGDAISERVWKDEHFLGCIWTEGEGLAWSYRRYNTESQCWYCDSYEFPTRSEALNGILEYENA